MSTRKAARQLRQQEDLCVAPRYPPRGQRSRAGARDLVVDLLVDEVVIGAAGAAHQHRAHEKQHEIPGHLQRRSAMPGIGGQHRRPPAGPQQQLPADRALPARKLCMRPEAFAAGSGAPSFRAARRQPSCFRRRSCAGNASVFNRWSSALAMRVAIAAAGAKAGCSTGSAHEHPHHRFGRARTRPCLEDPPVAPLRCAVVRARQSGHRAGGAACRRSIRPTTRR